MIIRLFRYCFFLGLITSPVHAGLVNELPRHPIDLDSHQVPIREVMRSFGRMGKVSFVGLDTLEGNVSLQLHQIPWNDAFELLLESKDLSYIDRNRLIWVAPKSTILQSALRNDLYDDPHDPPIKQVLIEAKIVEADTKFIQSLGVKLQAFEHEIGDNFKNKATYEGIFPSDSVNGFKPAAAALTMFSKAANPLLTLELTALESDGRGRIVASPRIVTTNQIKALIEQGTEVPYQLSTKSTSKVHFKKANLRLEVTPTIKKNHIVLDVEIVKDSLGPKTNNGFSIDNKHLRSQIIIENGGTVAIGGVYQEVEQNETVQVPLLGSIPLIGNFFKHRTKVRDKTELLVFLTPTILP